MMADRYSTGVLSHDVPTELERLRLLEAMLHESTTGILGKLGIAESWRCLELGAGAGGVARWLAERCPSGEVIAADVDTRFLDADHAGNLEVHAVDARAARYAPGSFDLIHARALLMHLPEREQVLAKAVRWLAPGGWLVIEDPAIFPAQSSPHSVWRTLLNAFAALLAQQGTDLSWARRRLPTALSDNALIDLGLAMNVTIVGDGGPGETMWRVFLDQVGPSMIDRRLIGAHEFAAACRLLDDPGFLDTTDTLISAWGRKPVRPL